MTKDGKSFWREVRGLGSLVGRYSPPKLQVEVDSQIAYQGLLVPDEESLRKTAAFYGRGPASLEEWWEEVATRLEDRFPEASEVAVWGVWAGNPPARKLLGVALKEFPF